MKLKKPVEFIFVISLAVYATCGMLKYEFLCGILGCVAALSCLAYCVTTIVLYYRYNAPAKSDRNKVFDITKPITTYFHEGRMFCSHCNCRVFPFRVCTADIVVECVNCKRVSVIEKYK